MRANNQLQPANQSTGKKPSKISPAIFYPFSILPQPAHKGRGREGERQASWPSVLGRKELDSTEKKIPTRSSQRKKEKEAKPSQGEGGSSLPTLGAGKRNASSTPTSSSSRTGRKGHTVKINYCPDSYKQRTDWDHRRNCAGKKNRNRGLGELKTKCSVNAQRIIHH